MEGGIDGGEAVVAQEMQQCGFTSIVQTQKYKLAGLVRESWCEIMIAEQGQLKEWQAGAKFTTQNMTPSSSNYWAT